MLLTFFHLFTKKLRLGNPWRYKIPLLIGLTYFFLLVGNLNSTVAFFSFLAAVCTAVGFAGIGYLTNDLSDKSKDLLAGKDNIVGDLSAVFVGLLGLLFVALALGPWFYLPLDYISIILIITEITLFIIYAFPPFRLKEKGILGLVADALYAHVIPAILASWTFFLVGGKQYEYMIPFLISLSAWQLVCGIRNILSHQLKDYENDIKSNMTTYIVKRGVDGMENKMNRIFIPLEITLFLVFILFIHIEVTYMLPVLFIYWVIALNRFPKTVEDKSQPLSKHRTNILDKFYIQWLPFIIITGGIFIDMEVRYIILGHILLFMKFPYKILRKIKDKIG
ncbi:MAG: hypothetical protein QNK23_16125 [Crocinitomicaceae bacterium]|nr:hypothetical protein [Crocinitomicaceae bacterium]